MFKKTGSPQVASSVHDPVSRHTIYTCQKCGKVKNVKDMDTVQYKKAELLTCECGEKLS